MTLKLNYMGWYVVIFNIHSIWNLWNKQIKPKSLLWKCSQWISADTYRSGFMSDPKLRQIHLAYYFFSSFVAKYRLCNWYSTSKIGIYNFYGNDSCVPVWLCYLYVIGAPGQVAQEGTVNSAPTGRGRGLAAFQAILT